MQTAEKWTLRVCRRHKRISRLWWLYHTGFVFWEISDKKVLCVLGNMTLNFYSRCSGICEQHFWQATKIPIKYSFPLALSFQLFVQTLSFNFVRTNKKKPSKQFLYHIAEFLSPSLVCFRYCQNILNGILKT